MPRFLLRLYRKSEPSIHPGELIDRMEIEAEDVHEAEASAFDLRATFPEAVNFGVLHRTNGEPFSPLDFRRRQRT